MIILVNKPHGVMCQFRPVAGRRTLADLVPVPSVYPAGRLDADSEGLVVLTDDGRLQGRISHPRHKMAKAYYAQVEGIPGDRELCWLASGVDVGDFVSQPCTVRQVEEPRWLWPRDPPIRYRASVPTTWLEIVLREGKNRQVRRMTAKTGHPTLRLIRWAVGDWTLKDLAPGKWRRVDSV